MKSFSDPTQLCADYVGEAAWDLLKSGSHGCILAVFSKVIYLNSTYDELFWFATENIPMHRRGIQIHGAIPRASAGSSFIVRGQHLILGKDIEIDLSPASKWVPPRPNLDKILPFEHLPDRLRAISCMFDSYPAPTGFGWILSELTRNATGSPLPAPLPEFGHAMQYAWPTLNEIVQACNTNDFPQILGIAENLIGLGEGLTPSGDDFIGGLLFADFTIHEIYPKYQGLTLTEVELFLNKSRNRTNLISYTMLKDLAKGNAAETLHRFINSILTCQNLNYVHSAGLELVRIGHSTGWDLLTGLWTGMLLSIHSRAVITSSIPSSISS